MPILQITDDVKSETMKVTTCSPTGYHSPPSGYGYGQQNHEDKGEHQYCREEYQTQEYRLPKVEEPNEVGISPNTSILYGTCVVSIYRVTPQVVLQVLLT